MAVARIKLLRNKREAVVRQMRRDIALLLQSKQDATARIRVIFVFCFICARSFCCRGENFLFLMDFVEKGLIFDFVDLRKLHD